MINTQQAGYDTNKKPIVSYFKSNSFQNIIMLAELHCHTNYSKGRKIRVEGVNTVEEMIRTGAQKGIDVIAITDHDTVKAHAVARIAAKRHDILFIPGIEVST